MILDAHPNSFFSALLEHFNMFWTSITRAAAPAPKNLGKSLQRLLPEKLPPSLVAYPGNLYEVLSRTPTGGIGKRVYQLRWSEKNIDGCYWQVTKTVFKREGKHGKAWGMLYWKGINLLFPKLDNYLLLLGSLRQTNQRAPGEDKGITEVHLGRGTVTSVDKTCMSFCAS